MKSIVTVSSPIEQQSQHPFNGLFSRTSWVSQYQKGKTSLDLNEPRDDGVLGRQQHQLDNMQTICTLLGTDNHSNTSLLKFLQTGCSSWYPSNSVKALKALELIETQPGPRKVCNNRVSFITESVVIRFHCVWLVSLYSVILYLLRSLCQLATVLSKPHRPVAWRWSLFLQYHSTRHPTYAARPWTWGYCIAWWACLHPAELDSIYI